MTGTTKLSEAPEPALLHRRLALIIACALMLFLGVYTWNQRTGHLDRLCASVGLEFAGGVMRGLNDVQDSITGFWENYVDLRGVKQRNDMLERKV